MATFIQIIQSKNSVLGWVFIAFIVVALFPAMPYMRDLTPEGTRTVRGLSSTILVLSLALAMWYWYRKLSSKSEPDILFGAPVPLALGILGIYAFCNGMWMTEYDKKFAVPSTK